MRHVKIRVYNVFVSRTREHSSAGHQPGVIRSDPGKGLVRESCCVAQPPCLVADCAIRIGTPLVDESLLTRS